jgi:cytochrome P450
MIDMLIDSLLHRTTEFDAVPQIAQAVPVWALFDLMQIPASDHAQLATSTRAAFDDSDESPAATRRRASAHAAIFAYFEELVEFRKLHLGDDLVSSLLMARVNDELIRDEDVILNCNGLLSGGLETTPLAIAGAIQMLAETPGALDKLNETPSDIETAVQEVLRWTSPAMQAMRTATQSTLLGDAMIRSGDRVVIWLPACNRDPQVFASPDAIDFLRQPNPQMSFGGGPHMCIAAALARMEVRCTLQSLTRRVSTIEVVNSTRLASSFLNGLSHLVVRLIRRPA